MFGSRCRSPIDSAASVFEAQMLDDTRCGALLTVAKCGVIGVAPAVLLTGPREGAAARPRRLAWSCVDDPVLWLTGNLGGDMMIR